MRVKVPGAASSTGSKAQDFTLPAGEFAFEIISANVKESANSPCYIHDFEMIVIDGPDDPKTGKTTQGRKFHRRIVQLLPEHASYREDDTRAADEIHELGEAAGIEIADDDSYETDDFGGQKVQASLGVRTGKDADGEPQLENTVKRTKGDDGASRMWHPDSGKPVSRSKASVGGSKPKVSAPARKR